MKIRDNQLNTNIKQKQDYFVYNEIKSEVEVRTVKASPKNKD